MQGANQNCQLLLFDVLQFVNEHYNRNVRHLSGLANSFQQRRQILFQISVVGQTRLRVEIDPYLNVLILEFERLGETRQCPESSFGQLLCTLGLTKLQQGKPKLGRQQRRE